MLVDNSSSRCADLLLGLGLPKQYTNSKDVESKENPTSTSTTLLGIDVDARDRQGIC